jgi:ribose transport system substrate-binding protein
MTRLMSTLCAAVALAAFVAACGDDSSDSSSGASSNSGSAQKEQKNYTIAYANVADSSPLFKLVGDKMVTDGKKVGITVKRFDNNFDPAKALSNAQLMVQQKPDLIIDWTGTESIGKSVGAVFSRAKIPCVAVNQTIEGCPYFNLQNKLLGSGAAEIVAPAMTEKGWTAADTTTVFLFNPGAGAEVNSNGRYFYSDLAKKFPEMKQAEPDDITDKTTTYGTARTSCRSTARTRSSRATRR